MRHAAWFVLGLCLVTSGCASGGGTSQRPHASGTPTASASLVLARPTSSVTVVPVDAAWPRPEEIRQYRAALKPVNRRLTALSRMPATAGIDATRAALSAYADASGDAAQTLSGGSWGPDVRGHVNTLIAALLDQRTFLDGLAAAPTVAAIQARSDRTGQVLLVTKASGGAVEKDLGIGSGLLGLTDPSSGAP